MGKRQVCILLSEDLYEELKRVSEETGLPLSKVIELRLRGYEIVKVGRGGLSSILETIEELLDREGLERVREGLRDYEEGRYTVVRSPEELKRELLGES